MPTVLRIPRHDDETSFVLLNVDKSKTGSSCPLDLNLIGTENEAVYVLNCKFHLKVGLTGVDLEPKLFMRCADR